MMQSPWAKAFVLTLPFFLPIYLSIPLILLVQAPFGLDPVAWKMFLLMIAPALSWILLWSLNGARLFRIDTHYMHAAALMQWVMFIAGVGWLFDVPGTVTAAMTAPGTAGTWVRIYQAMWAIFHPYLIVSLVLCVAVTAVDIWLATKMPGDLRRWFRLQYNLAVYNTSWRPARSMDSGFSAFADPAALAREYKDGELIIGLALPLPVEQKTVVSQFLRRQIIRAKGLTEDRSKAPVLRVSIDGHAIIWCGSGGGKSVCFAIPNLLEYTAGSVFVLDVKGELYEVTADARRALGNRVYRLAVGDPDSDSLDVTGWIHPEIATFGLDVMTIAAALVPESSGGSSEGGAYFKDRARAAITTCFKFEILEWFYQCKKNPGKPPARPTLTTIYRRLQRSPDEVAKYFKDMRDGIRGFIKESQDNGTPLRYGAVTLSLEQDAGQFIGQDEKTWANVVSSISNAIWWIGDENNARMLCGQTDGKGQVFDAAEIIDGKTTVYMCIPPKILEALPAPARLAVSAFINAMINCRRDEVRGRTMFMLDEVQSLGSFDMVHKTALERLRGYGGMLIAICQAPSGLEGATSKHIRESWQDSAMLQLYWCMRSIDTAETVSRILGETTVETLSVNTGTSTSGGHTQVLGSGGGNVGFSSGGQSRRLKTAAEVLQSKRAYAFAIVGVEAEDDNIGRRPMMIGTCYYKNRPEMKAKARQTAFNPDGERDYSLYLTPRLKKATEGGFEFAQQVAEEAARIAAGGDAVTDADIDALFTAAEPAAEGHGQPNRPVAAIRLFPENDADIDAGGHVAAAPVPVDPVDFSWAEGPAAPAPQPVVEEAWGNPEDVDALAVAMAQIDAAAEPAPEPDPEPEPAPVKPAPAKATKAGRPGKAPRMGALDDLRRRREEAAARRKQADDEDVGF